MYCYYNDMINGFKNTFLNRSPIIYYVGPTSREVFSYFSKRNHFKWCVMLNKTPWIGPQSQTHQRLGFAGVRTRPWGISSFPLSLSWHCPLPILLSLEGSPVRRGRAESVAPHPQWCHGGMLAQRALASWAEDEKLSGWMWLGVRVLWNWRRPCDSCHSTRWMDFTVPCLRWVCV